MLSFQTFKVNKHKRSDSATFEREAWKKSWEVIEIYVTPEPKHSTFRSLSMLINVKIQQKKEKQGRIHGHPSCVQVGRISDEMSEQIVLAGVMRQQVKRGHNIIADGLAGACNPHPYAPPHT